MPTKIIRNRPTNLVNTDEWIFENAITYYFEEPTYERFSKGIWDCFNGNAIESVVKKWKFYLSIIVARKYLINFESFIWVTNEYSENYFHWFNDVIPSILFLRKVGVNFPILLSSKLSAKTFVISSLRFLNITYKVVDANNIVRFKVAIKPTLTAGEGNQHPIYFPQLSQIFRSRCGQESGTSCRVFLVRNSSNFRILSPVDRVNKLFEEYGFIIVEAENMSFDEQLNLFSKCTHLAGVHGAGLTNMLFMKSNSKILEIRRNDDDHNNCYFSMANVLNFNYYYFLVSGGSNKATVQEDDFTADLDSLKEMLDVFTR